MSPRHMFNPEGFRNITKDGEIIGFQFDMKILYYRGITLSILRNIEVNIDGVGYLREDIRFTVNNETFTLDEMRTVISNRWLFGQYATVSVMAENGLSRGKHHLQCTQTIAPSYMPCILTGSGEYDFEIV